MAVTMYDVPVHVLSSRMNPDRPGTLGEFSFAGHRFPARCHNGWTVTLGPIELAGVDYWTAEAAVRAYVASLDPGAVAEQIEQIEGFRRIVAEVTERHEAARATMRVHVEQAQAAAKRAAAAYRQADREVDGDQFIDYVNAWSCEASRCSDYCAKTQAQAKPDTHTTAYWAALAERALSKCADAFAQIGLELTAD